MVHMNTHNPSRSLRLSPAAVEALKAFREEHGVGYGDAVSRALVWIRSLQDPWAEATILAPPDREWTDRSVQSVVEAIQKRYGGAKE